MDIIHEKFRKTISKIIRSKFKDQVTNPNGVAVLTFDDTTCVHKVLEFVKLIKLLIMHKTMNYTSIIIPLIQLN